MRITRADRNRQDLSRPKAHRVFKKTLKISATGRKPKWSAAAVPHSGQAAVVPVAKPVMGNREHRYEENESRALVAGRQLYLESV